MATTSDYVDYICEQISKEFAVRSRKMFGEYMVYINEKPILLVCDNTVYVKMLDDIKNLMHDESTGYPYEGAKEHYILPIDDCKFSNDVIRILEKITPIPKPKKKKSTN